MLTTSQKLDRLERLHSLRVQLGTLRIHRAHGGGNPHHDEHGKFTTGDGGGSRTPLTPDQKKRADAFREYARKEQAEQHADHKAARKELIAEQKAEHAALRREQAAERKALPKEHAREARELDREHARDRKQLDKDQARELKELEKGHAKELAKADPEDHAELIADHADAVRDMHADHESDRVNLIESQAMDREQLAATHSAALAEQADLHKAARDDQRQEFRDSRQELKDHQADERRELRGRLRDELKELKQEFREELKGERSLARAVPDRFTPGRTLKASSAESILRVCLRKTGFTKAYRKAELSGLDHLRLLEEVRIYGQAWLHHEAAAFVAKYGGQPAERTLTGVVGQHAKRLFGRMKTFVKELYVAGSMALLGPRPLTEKELHAIDRQHQVQVAYFDRFEGQAGQTPVIVDSQGEPVGIGPKPQQPLDGTFAARAEQYGASVWGAVQEVARASAADAFTVERRVHVGDDEPCRQCVEEQARGWEPIGSLRPIGDCLCRINCHCHFEYKVHPDDSRIYYAGQTPDNAADFGSNVIDA